jgi:hypothetical protein
MCTQGDDVSFQGSSDFDLLHDRSAVTHLGVPGSGIPVSRA